MANALKTICGLSIDFLKKNPEVRQALFQTKQKLNSILVSEGKISGAQTTMTKEAKKIYESLVKAEKKAASKGLKVNSAVKKPTTTKSSNVIKRGGRTLVPINEYNGHRELWRRSSEVTDTSAIRKLEEKINDLYKKFTNPETNEVPGDIYYEIEKAKSEIKYQLKMLKTY